jgi:hypothetical protein
MSAYPVVIMSAPSGLSLNVLQSRLLSNFLDWRAHAFRSAIQRYNSERIEFGPRPLRGLMMGSGLLFFALWAFYYDIPLRGYRIVRGVAQDASTGVKVYHLGKLDLRESSVDK